MTKYICNGTRKSITPQLHKLDNEDLIISSTSSNYANTE